VLWVTSARIKPIFQSPIFSTIY